MIKGCYEQVLRVLYGNIAKRSTSRTKYWLDRKRKFYKKPPLFPEYKDYEERKAEIKKRNLSPLKYQEAIKELAEEFNL